MKSNISIFLYARLNSKRLPKKVFLKMGEKNVIEIVIERLKKLKVLRKKISLTILTTKSKNDDKLIQFCKKRKLNYFRGSEENVLSRTVNCIKKLKVKNFIRINCDRPFIDYKKLVKMIKYFEKKDYDILTNNLTFCPSGLVIEILKSKIFLENYSKIKKKSDKEHILNYFYKNRKNFFIKNFPYRNSLKLKKIKLSLDSSQDYNKFKKVYEKFNYDYNIDTKKVINYLLKDKKL